MNQDDYVEIKIHNPVREKPGMIELLKNADGVYDDHHSEEQRRLWDEADALTEMFREELLW